MTGIFENIGNFFGRIAAVLRKDSPKKTEEADAPSTDAASREAVFAEVAYRVIEDVRKV